MSQFRDSRLSALIGLCLAVCFYSRGIDVVKLKNDMPNRTWRLSLTTRDVLSLRYILFLAAQDDDLVRSLNAPDHTSLLEIQNKLNVLYQDIQRGKK